MKTTLENIGIGPRMVELVKVLYNQSTKLHQENDIPLLNEIKTEFKKNSFETSFLDRTNKYNKDGNSPEYFV